MGINSRGYTKLTSHSTFFKGDAVVWEQQTLTKIILTINNVLEDIINEYSETILKIHNKIRENTPILKKILDNSFYISDRVNKLMRVFERIVGNQILFLNKVFLLSEVIHLRDKIIWIILEYKFYVTFTRIYEYKFLFTTKYYLENEFIRNYLFEVNKKNINIEFLIRRTYYVTIVLLKKANFISNIYKNATLK